MSHFGGDDIDKLLEEADYGASKRSSKRESYNAVPPPSQLQPSLIKHKHNKHKNETNNKPLQRERERDRDRDRDSRDKRRKNRSRDRSRERDRDRKRHNKDRDRTDRIDKSDKTDKTDKTDKMDINQDQNRQDNNHGRSRSGSVTYDDPIERRRQREIKREQEHIERDQRTVFACQIHPKCDERDIFEFFSNVGRVVDVQLIRDNRTFKSKGLCYVEFEDKSSVAHALALTNQLLGGFPISVQLTQAEKHRAAQAQLNANGQSGILTSSINSTNQTTYNKSMKLHVSNINPQVKGDDIEPLFSAFGEINYFEIIKDPKGNSLGYGFVEFKSERDAIGAMQELNDIDLLDQKIKITEYGSSTTITSNNDQNINNNNNNSIQQSSFQNINLIESSSSRINQLSINNENNKNRQLQSQIQKDDILTKLGIKPLNSTQTTAHARQQRDQVQKQHISNVAQNIHPSRLQQMGLTAQSIQQQLNNNNNNNNNVSSEQISRCILLSGMFDPTQEEDADFDMEIREDVKDEASKYGKLLHIYVDKTNRDGLVYLKFKHENEALRTKESLDGRWFAKRQIKATFYNEQRYNAEFP